MEKTLKRKGYFTRFELILWSLSITVIVATFLLFDRTGYVNFISSIIGATCLILGAKGNPLGHALGIAFGIIYSVISYEYRYYGELITYAFMTVPMSVYALVEWLRHPYKGNKMQVKVNKLGRRDYIVMAVLAAAVTVVFYFVLDALGTKNMIPSTISIATSFSAVYLSARRSEHFALAYAANDIVLMVLWGMASYQDISYLSVFICFGVFFVNDVYSFFAWRKMKKLQGI